MCKVQPPLLKQKSYVRSQKVGAMQCRMEISFPDQQLLRFSLCYGMVQAVNSHEISEKTFRGAYRCLTGNFYFLKILCHHEVKTNEMLMPFENDLCSACFHFLSRCKLVPWQLSPNTGVVSSPQRQEIDYRGPCGGVSVAQSIPSTCTTIYVHWINVWWMNEPLNRQMTKEAF